MILLSPADVEDRRLSRIAVGVLRVTPVAREAEPVDRCALIVRCEGRAAGVVGVVVGGERGIPHWAAVGEVLDQALREIDVGCGVVVRAGYGIIGVATVSAVGDRLSDCQSRFEPRSLA